jgi:hypothetical protein
MENNYISFENVYDRGKYARDVSGLLKNNNLNWKAFPSVMKSEIFIRPNDPPEENLRDISRISLQMIDGKINFGLSGYHPNRVRETKRILENKGYRYHDKGYTSDGRPMGRWWLVKSLDKLESIITEFKDIEPLILQK